MVSKVSRSKVREEKHRRMRRHIIGTPERPRMAVFRSNNHMYVQIIDDVAKTTLVSASTLQKDVKEKLEKTNDVAAAAYLGTVIAKKAQEAGIKSVVFDRGGFIYQGKIQALADAAREAGQIETIVHSHEPDVEVSEIVQESYIPEKKQEANESYNNEDKKLTVRLATGAAIYAIGMALTVFAKVPLPIELAFLIVSYVILGGDVVWQAVRNISKGRVFDEHFLMSVSTIGAFVIGEYPEAVAVMLFYQVGEFFQSLAVKRSRKSISDLMDIRPDSATVRRNGELITISPENVSIGEIIIVKPGEKIPLDGVVLDGDSMLDTRALTGESVPRSVHKGDEALSGCMNQTGVLMIKTTKAFGESTASKIIDLVENASSRKAPTENFITTFARYYTPVVVILAAFLAILPPIILGGGWTEWIRRGFVFLVVPLFFTRITFPAKAVFSSDVHSFFL